MRRVLLIMAVGVVALWPSSDTSRADVSATAALLDRQGITDPTAIRAAIEADAEHLGPVGARNDQYGHGLLRSDLALVGLGLGQ